MASRLESKGSGVIVIDVGCAKWGGDESIPHLVREYKPEFLYGFDPGAMDGDYNVEDTVVRVRRQAAWVHDGTVGFQVAGLGGRVDDQVRTKFACFDLARYIESLNPAEIVLKIDAEGAEYMLLPHLVERGADLLLKLAVVEWHCAECGIGGNGRHREMCPSDRQAWWDRRNAIESQMRCETVEWNL